jgi:hypothetical protein
MAYRLPSATNVFSISFESTYMVVSATRDPKKFKLAKYIQLVPTKTRVFRYLKLDLDEPARVVTSQDFAWAPGQNAPDVPNVGAFQFVDTGTTKYAYPWTLPQESVDQAEWDIENSQMGIVQQKAMTNRTILVATLAQTAANWPPTNTGDNNTLNGGRGPWETASSDPASAYYLAIKKGLQAAATAVVLQTNAVMKWNDLNLVISPTLANGGGSSSEIYDYVKGTPDSFARQKGEDAQIGEYGMPPMYAGLNIIVEDAVKVTSRPNASSGLGTGGTRTWVWGGSSAVLLARQGGITAQFGGPSFSTIQLYAYREMEVKTKSDVDNERVQGRITDDFATVLAFGQSGYLITNCT